MEYWKFKAIDKLRDYPAQRQALLNLPDEISRLESEARSIRSTCADATPVKGGGSTREDKILSNIVNREELKALLYRATKAVTLVDRALSALDAQDTELLDRMYMHRVKGYMERLVENLALEDVRSVYKRADKALYRFTIAIYGATES